jgi:predicted lipid-binding transport protein (Tim44 family)
MNFRTVTAFALAAALALAPALAEARPGGGGSIGSRGARTFAPPAPTRTAPAPAKPIERSVTPQAAPTPQPGPQVARPALPAPQPSFAQRNPFVTGLLGGLVGAGIAGMLFGHGFGWGGMGFGGGLGVLLQLLILGGLAWWLVSRFQARRTEDSYAFAGNAAPQAAGGYAAAGAGAPSHAAAASSDEIGLTNADFDDFERLLDTIMKEWSAGDVAGLRRHVTPEMLSYFAEELAANASKGIVNSVSDVQLEQGDLSEAWREGDIEYATVALGYSLIDYSTAEDGRIVAGSRTARQKVTEVWTFMRQAGGGRWLLSAIQQT